MRMSTLLFANRSLEDRFRKLVDSKFEVGGFLFVNTWRQDVVRSTAMNAYNNTYPQVIYSWLFIPNLAETPEDTWATTPELLAAFKDSAELTAGSLYMSPLFFHSHPVGTSDPSPQDIAFTLNHCPVYKNSGEQAIVSLNPLRVYLYYIERSKKQITIEEGEFLSWRSKELREMAREKSR